MTSITINTFKCDLDKKDRKMFDQMYDYVKLNNAACRLPKSILISLDENHRPFKDDRFHSDVLERKKRTVPPSLLGMDILHKFKLIFNDCIFGTLFELLTHI
jgi:hypothetical protein